MRTQRKIEHLLEHEGSGDTFRYLLNESLALCKVPGGTPAILTMKLTASCWSDKRYFRRISKETGFADGDTVYVTEKWDGTTMQALCRCTVLHLTTTRLHPRRTVGCACACVHRYARPIDRMLGQRCSISACQATRSDVFKRFDNFRKGDARKFKAGDVERCPCSKKSMNLHRNFTSIVSAAHARARCAPPAAASVVGL